MQGSRYVGQNYEKGVRGREINLFSYCIHHPKKMRLENCHELICQGWNLFKK